MHKLKSQKCSEVTAVQRSTRSFARKPCPTVSDVRTTETGGESALQTPPTQRHREAAFAESQSPVVPRPELEAGLGLHGANASRTGRAPPNYHQVRYGCRDPNSSSSWINALQLPPPQFLMLDKPQFVLERCLAAPTTAFLRACHTPARQGAVAAASTTAMHRTQQSPARHGIIAVSSMTAARQAGKPSSSRNHDCSLDDLSSSCPINSSPS